MNLAKGEKFYEYTNFFKNYYTFLKEHLDSKNKLSQENTETIGIKIYNAENLKVDSMIIREDVAKRIKNTVLRALLKENKTVFYHLYGQTGIGKKTLTKQVSRVLGKDLMIVDLELFIDEYVGEWKDKFLEIIDKNKNPEVVLCLDNFYVFTDENSKVEKEAISLIKITQNYFKTVFILSSSKVDDSIFQEDFFWFEEEIPDLNSDENFKIWEKCISEIKNITDEKSEEISSKFTFTPKQTVWTIRQLKKEYLKNQNTKLSKEQFYKCAYNQVISTLNKKAKLITKKFTWDDMVLDDETKLKLCQACDRVKYKYQVYNTWGMESNLSYGKGLSMLFQGSPGTGKTMAAQVIANELGLDLYKINMASVISKYVGETEKNLKEIFDEAKKSHVILLFDEADSLFSKRTDIKDSHDRNANMEVSFLLQEMEDYNGILILTTNKANNIDEAFDRRFTFKMAFPRISLGAEGSSHYEKNLKMRTDLWNKFLRNGKLPLDDDIDFKYLIQRFGDTGAEIKKIALSAAFLAASQSSEKVSMRHVLLAIRDVKNVNFSDFGKYQDVLKEYLGIKIEQKNKCI